MLEPILTKLKNFRHKIFQCFSARSGATMDLIDALSSNVTATSAVQLSLNTPFRRKYGSVRDAITHFSADPKQQMNIERCLIQECDATTETRPFRLFALDCTAAPRKYAKTLTDKGIVHAPNVVPGNKPITVGHQYSVVGYLPERSLENDNIPWMLPLSTCRVETNTNGIAVGTQQMNRVLGSFAKDLSVIVGDTAYSCPEFIEGIQKHENAVLVARLKGNRILNQKALAKILKPTGRRERGHELWYGAEFNMKDECTWHVPDECITHSLITRKGKQFMVHIRAWNDMLVRQKNGIPMNEYPFRVLRIRITDEQGNFVYKRPMWLMVSGNRRQELSLTEIWKSYSRRYDIEHYFKFGKTRLLMDKFQTPDTKHEESWWQIAALAYAQLYMSRTLATNLPNPWERYLPEMNRHAAIKSARQVQKSFTKITAAIGTPASAPKPRGKPLGRLKGTKQIRRLPSPIIFKGIPPPKQRAA